MRHKRGDPVYYIVTDTNGKIIDLKDTPHPPPHPDWLPRGWQVFPVVRSVYEQVLHHGPRRYKVNDETVFVRAGVVQALFEEGRVRSGYHGSK